MKKEVSMKKLIMDMVKSYLTQYIQTNTDLNSRENEEKLLPQRQQLAKGLYVNKNDFKLQQIKRADVKDF
jgi:hypothetical protein